MNHFSRPLTALLFLVAASAGAQEAQVFSHDDWTSVLQEYVDEKGFVDYRGLAKDRELLDRYVAAIESDGPRTNPDAFPSRDHELAFYINAYNAHVFHGVLERGPEEKSVWRGLVSGLNFFVLRKVTVDGKRMSLKWFEDVWIREGFKDARIHAALNCASISCPRLPQVAFSGENLQEELDAAMTEFVRDPRNCTIDEKKKVVRISEIFDFFPKDFLADEKKLGNKDPRIVDYVNRFLPEDGQVPRDFKVVYFKYDKGINKQ